MGKLITYALAGLFGVTIGLLVGIPFGLANAWCVATVWGWLAVPLFHAPPLTFIQVYAGMCVFNMIRGYHEVEPVKGDKLKELWLEIAVWYVVAMTLAWVVKHFI